MENFLLEATTNRPAKKPEAWEQVARILYEVNADLVALQEIGGRKDLEALAADLGPNRYPVRLVANVSESPIQVGLLSRFPVRNVRLHTNDFFLLHGRRFKMSRGVLEAEVEVATNYQVVVFVAHLKSRRFSLLADEAQLREEEARVLRARVEERLKANPRVNLMVVGDFNDHPHSVALRLLVGRGKLKLTDTRPREQAMGSTARRAEEKGPAWTYYFSREETWSRADYILISGALLPEWIPDRTFIPYFPNWSLASDHRPILATFQARDLDR